MTGVAKNTVTKLLCDLGAACADYQDRTLRKLPCERVQVDEIWSFCGMKQKNVPDDRRGEFGVGDVWTWTAICADTKIVPCWHVGQRDGIAARQFVCDLASRMAGRIQLTSDGHKPYLEAVEAAFGGQVDYAMLIKQYGSEPGVSPERRYSPAVCTGCKREPVVGEPDDAHISTSYVERQNLTMRMRVRRYTRLTNGFSKKAENHMHATSLHFMHYNFVRRHQTLRVTPAMAAGVTDRLWSVADLVGILEDSEDRSN